MRSWPPKSIEGDDAAALLKEATELAESTGSDGVLRWVAGARERLNLQ